MEELTGRLLHVRRRLHIHLSCGDNWGGFDVSRLMDSFVGRSGYNRLGHLATKKRRGHQSLPRGENDLEGGADWP